MREKNTLIHTKAGIEGNRKKKQRKIELKIERDEMKRNKEILYCGRVCVCVWQLYETRIRFNIIAGKGASNHFHFPVRMRNRKNQNGKK